MVDLNGRLRLHERCLITRERVGAERLLELAPPRVDGQDVREGSV